MTLNYSIESLVHPESNHLISAFLTALFFPKGIIPADYFFQAVWTTVADE